MQQRIDYKSVFMLLRDKYPTIAEELAPMPRKADLTDMGGIINRFMEIKECTFEDLQGNRDDLQVLFLAAVVQMYDPAFFIYERKKLKTGLRASLHGFLGGDPTFISHRLRSIKMYLQVYQDLKAEVKTISEQL